MLTIAAIARDLVLSTHAVFQPDGTVDRGNAFENLSSDKENAYFAEGIQDEILTRLSITDLKVISPSTQHYKSAPENLPEIASNSVAPIFWKKCKERRRRARQCATDQAATDSHLWSETFDRKMTDIFSVESEVSKAIADQLRAKLTGQNRKSRHRNRPTILRPTMPTRGLAYTLKTAFTTANSLAQKYLKEAVQLDPIFAARFRRCSLTTEAEWLSYAEPSTAGCSP
jgi:TolB-like protein